MIPWAVLLLNFSTTGVEKLDKNRVELVHVYLPEQETDEDEVQADGKNQAESAAPKEM